MVENNRSLNSNDLNLPVTQEVETFFTGMQPLTPAEVIQERTHWQEVFDELREEISMPEFLDVAKRPSFDEWRGTSFK